MADTVLIVDDDESVQTMLYKVIRSNGLNAEVASGGQEAVMLATRHSYDLILLDVNMPEMAAAQPGYPYPHHYRQRTAGGL